MYGTIEFISDLISGMMFVLEIMFYRIKVIHLRVNGLFSVAEGPFL